MDKFLHWLHCFILKKTGNTLEAICGVEPLPGWNPQSAGQWVGAAILCGGLVCPHPFGPFHPIHPPAQSQVVRVETRGQTHQRGLALLLDLLLWWGKDGHSWRYDFLILPWNTKQHGPEPPSLPSIRAPWKWSWLCAMLLLRELAFHQLSIGQLMSIGQETSGKWREWFSLVTQEHKDLATEMHKHMNFFYCLCQKNRKLQRSWAIRWAEKCPVLLQGLCV